MSQYGYLDHSALAHHGVKGMKWGIRKQKARRIISNIKTFTKSKHGKRALATGAAIGAVSGGAIGTMIGVSKLKQKKDMERLRAADAEEWLRRNGMLFEPDYFEYDKFQHSALMHHGIKGMKWGIRRYQNPDGSLTPEGEKRYYSYEGAKRARRLKNAGMVAGLGAGFGGVASILASAYKDSKTPENIKDSKEYKRSESIKLAGSGAVSLAGMLAGAGIEAKNSKRLEDIIKNASPEEFNKIKNDKHFQNNLIVRNRIHFDNFEKRNRITKSMSNKQKAELYVKEMFKKNPPILGDPSNGEYDEDAWYDAKLGGDWYGINRKDLEKMCWKYHNQYLKTIKH